MVWPWNCHSIRADLSYTFTIKLPIFGEKLPILTGTRQRSRKHFDWTLVSIENLDETKHWPILPVHTPSKSPLWTSPKYVIFKVHPHPNFSSFDGIPKGVRGVTDLVSPSHTLLLRVRGGLIWDPTHTLLLGVWRCTKYDPLLLLVNKDERHTKYVPPLTPNKRVLVGSQINPLLPLVKEYEKGIPNL